MEVTDLLVWAVILHLVADWIFQNDWMARNKSSLKHPAAWVHGGIHAVCLLAVLPAWAAFVAGLLHMAVDTRKPGQWWQRVYGQTTEGPWAMHVAIWLDQVVHVAVLALVVLMVSLWK